jgi:DNA-binding GntR family transcriptional regulator
MSGLQDISLGRVAAPLREQVLDALREAILRFELKPGQRLVERQLIEQTGVSRTTVREVLRELTAEGLVKVIPQRGAIVHSPTPDEAADLYAVRVSLESLAVQRFIERAPQEAVDALGETVTELGELISSGVGMLELLGAKDHFYDVLLDGAASPTVRQILGGVQARIRLLRATSMSQPGRPQQMLEELRALVEAIAARESDEATRLCAVHLNNAAAAGVSALPTEGEANGELNGNGGKPGGALVG